MRIKFFIVFLSFWAGPTFGGQDLIDLTVGTELENWQLTNDTVMGGRSVSDIQFVHNNLVFSGKVSLKNNGGFASTHRRLKPAQISDFGQIEIRLKGDGRTYQFRVKTTDSSRIAYSASFDTSAEQWMTLRFKPKDFVAVFRGRRVLDAPMLKFGNINQIGFMLADKTSGEFTLLVERLTTSELNQ